MPDICLNPVVSSFDLSCVDDDLVENIRALLQSPTPDRIAVTNMLLVQLIRDVQRLTDKIG
jgi:hypothetical protein